MCPRFIHVLTTAHLEKPAMRRQNMEHPRGQSNTGKGGARENTKTKHISSTNMDNAK
jgi:hypothetical protein